MPNQCSSISLTFHRCCSTSKIICLDTLILRRLQFYQSLERIVRIYSIRSSSCFPSVFSNWNSFNRAVLWWSSPLVAELAFFKGLEKLRKMSSSKKLILRLILFAFSVILFWSKIFSAGERAVAFSGLLLVPPLLSFFCRVDSVVLVCSPPFQFSFSNKMWVSDTFFSPSRPWFS